jgi:hypothetical protein
MTGFEYAGSILRNNIHLEQECARELRTLYGFSDTDRNILLETAR